MKGMILLDNPTANNERSPLPAPDISKLIYKDTYVPEISIDYILTNIARILPLLQVVR